MNTRRFVPPVRGGLEPVDFSHPLLKPYRHWHALLESAQWPDITQINQAVTVVGKTFVAQDDRLLSDGLHYEKRIALGKIATREGNWHDLFNALVWGRYPAIKRVLNAQQCVNIARMGGAERNAAQQAMTQFDESGLLVRVRDPALLALWDAHDWVGLFVDNAEAWRDDRIAIAAVFGHALLEQVLLPGRRVVGKCLVVRANDDAAAQSALVACIASGGVLKLPSELRPLPLAGIPGWAPQQDRDFYADETYFRPLRAGRLYPPPLA